MQTDKIKIRDFAHDEGREKALTEVEKFADYMGYDEKTALRARLLSEEVLGLAEAVTEKFRGDFWLEGEEGGSYRIHLLLKTDMDIDKKRELIDVSTNKKNAAYSGIIGKIREMIEDSCYIGTSGGLEALSVESAPGFFMLGMPDMSMANGAPIPMDTYTWSLDDYRQGLGEIRDDSNASKEAWDELEKSIIANLADDVRVAVKGNTAELTIEKKET